LSVFPLFRFTFIRTRPADLYFYYSVAGPTFISKTKIDDVNTGKHFTFQDLMGLGIFSGKNRNINAEVRIGHYSNGNIFPYNEGVKVPLTFNLGYAF
ncbi:MAG TPA: acyloxyacyl hydrolase, partial [Flavitalea sp.]|nr:acyloxyacyl hydrolase [Flavitalea sp.]